MDTYQGGAAQFISYYKSNRKAGAFLNLPLNSERLKKLTERYIVSNTKLKSALQIERMPLTAREGLQKTLKSFQQ